MEKPLGPFQSTWDAWNVVDVRCKMQPRSHFPRVVELQLKEIEAAWPDKAGVTKEVVDIISIALNWLRWLGFTDEEVAGVVEQRSLRYSDPEAIFAKYRQIMAPNDIV